MSATGDIWIPQKDKLVAYYPHVIGNGSTLYDYSGNDNNGLIVGATWKKKSDGLYSLDYTSTSTYTAIPDSTDFSFTDGSGNDLPFTISFWVNLRNVSAGKYFITKFQSSGSKLSEWDVYITGTNLYFFCWNSGNANAIYSYTSTTNIPINTWTMLSFTYDGSKNNTGMNIYIDTILPTQTRATAGTYTGMTNTTTSVYIGRVSDAVPLFNIDVMSDLIIHKNVSLSKTELEHIFKKTYRQ